MYRISDLLTQPLMMSAAGAAALLEQARAEAPKDSAPQRQPLKATLYHMAASGEITSSPQRNNEQRPSVAIIQLNGPLTRHGLETFWGSYPGMLETGRLINRLDLDPGISAIVLAIDSPGGTVTGAHELAGVVHGVARRGQTKIVSVADAMMASAAQLVGAAASESYAIPSATVGSIGVISMYSEVSEMHRKLGINHTILRTPERKALRTGVEPLSEAAIESMTKRLDQHYREFVQAMAEYRGVSYAHVEKHFGRGDTLRTDEAIDVGLLDGAVGSIDEVIGSLLRQPAKRAA